MKLPWRPQALIGIAVVGLGFMIRGLARVYVLVFEGGGLVCHGLYLAVKAR